MNLIIVFIRTLFFYFFILVSYRIMGKREIGQLSVSDLSISILIAELIAISIENKNDSILFTIIPVILLVFLEVFLSKIQLKENRLKKILDGKPSIIIDRGVLNIKEMTRQRFSIDDLLMSLREQNIKNIYTVEYAILEPNGKLSVFKKGNADEYPLPLIIDGVADKSTLRSIHRSEEWLKKKLYANNFNINDVLYAFYRNSTIYVVKKDET